VGLFEAVEALADGVGVDVQVLRGDVDVAVVFEVALGGGEDGFAAGDVEEGLM
jgi:hypothetical protein